MKNINKIELIRAFYNFKLLFYSYLEILENTKTIDNDFKENDHPRDKNGRFAKKEESNNDWGEAFTEFSNKPKEAINHLLKVKRGYVPNAFYRDDLGGIDLVYGNRNFGLKHIKKRRKNTKQDFDKLMADLPEIIEKGEILNDKDKEFKIILNKARKVLIKLTWGKKEPKEKRNWVFTAYYEF